MNDSFQKGYIEAIKKYKELLASGKLKKNKSKQSSSNDNDNFDSILDLNEIPDFEDDSNNNSQNSNNPQNQQQNQQSSQQNSKNNQKSTSQNKNSQQGINNEDDFENEENSNDSSNSSTNQNQNSSSQSSNSKSSNSNNNKSSNSNNNSNSNKEDINDLMQDLFDDEDSEGDGFEDEENSNNSTNKQKSNSKNSKSNKSNDEYSDDEGSEEAGFEDIEDEIASSNNTEELDSIRDEINSNSNLTKEEKEDLLSQCKEKEFDLEDSDDEENEDDSDPYDDEDFWNKRGGKHRSPEEESEIREMERLQREAEAVIDDLDNLTEKGKEMLDDEGEEITDEIRDSVKQALKELQGTDPSEKGKTRLEKLRDVIKTQQLKTEILKDIYDEKSAEKIKNRDLNTVRVKSFNSITQFKLSLLHYVKSLEGKIKGKTWKRFNSKAQSAGLIAKGRGKETKITVPVIYFYFDQSGSWTQDDLKKGLDALGTIERYEKKGLIKVVKRYFSETVHSLPRIPDKNGRIQNQPFGDNYRSEGGTSAQPVIDDIVKYKPDNVIIMTDNDTTSNRLSPEVTIPGKIWFLWKKGLKSEALRKTIKSALPEAANPVEEYNLM